jgi:ribosomal protein S18 acetylase RimI-like enzyme
MIKINKTHHVLLLVLLALISCALVFYFYSDQKQDHAFIRSYDEKKDFAALVNMINDNMFWVSERPDFPPEEFLALRAPNLDPSRKGQAFIDVIEADDATAGFVSYYKKSSSQGYIWVFAVGRDFRRRGYGERLLKHALAQLKKQGANYVTLSTRLAKTPAMQLYTKLGFVEQYRDEDRGMIFLIKRDI